MSEPNDQPLESILAQIKETMRLNPGAQCYIKWTCPKCGERATADEPNQVYMMGYTHEDCGGFYNGWNYGLMVIFGNEIPPGEEA